MNKNAGASTEMEEKKKRKALLPLFLLLLFFLLATSCIVGFLLGRTTEPGRYGALIDTIVLSPDGTEATPTPTPVPSLPPAAVTATPTLPAVTATPAPALPAVTGPAAERPPEPISLLGVVRYTDGAPFTRGAVELRSAPRYSQVSDTGRFRFDAVEPGEHRLAVLDTQGNVLASRTIRVDRDAVENAYMEYEETVCVLHIQTFTVEVDVELTLDLPGATLDVDLAHPTDAPATESPTVTDTPTATPAVPPTATPVIPLTPAPTPIPSPRPTSTVRPTPDDDPTPTPTPTGPVEVYHGESGVTWTQEAEIDLFRPLDGSPKRLLAPGSQGYYLFRLKNGRGGKVGFTLAIQEGSFHVPLEYRVIPDSDRDKPESELPAWQPAALDAETVSQPLVLEDGTQAYYRVEWRWPFHGDAAADTALGTREDRIYTLKLTIRAEDLT